VRFRGELLVLPGAPTGERCELCEENAVATFIDHGKATYWCGPHLEAEAFLSARQGDRR